MPAGSGMPGGMPPRGMVAAPNVPGGGAGVEQRIAIARQLVAQNPKDVQAWISLGNDYFDSKQPQAAVDAYAKALELDPKKTPTSSPIRASCTGTSGNTTRRSPTSSRRTESHPPTCRAS